MPENGITLTTIYEILQQHTARFDTMDKRFDTMEDRQDASDSLQKTMAVRLIAIEERLDEHSTILQPLSERVELLYGFMDTLDTRSSRIGQEYVMTTAALRRLEKRFDGLEAEKLRDRITNIESRVESIETNRTDD